MKIVDILLHLDNAPHAAQRTDVAALLATNHAARLHGLYTITPQVWPGAMGDGMIPGELIQALADQARQRAAEAEARFLATAKAMGVTATWAVADGHAPDLVARAGRTADLIVVGQDAPDQRPDAAGPGLAEDVALSAGRPVLAVPAVGRYPKVGERVLVAWNGTREAARALHDALPLLLKAKTVIVASVDEVEPGRLSPAAAAEHLVRHGVKAESRRIPAGDLSVGDALLGAVTDYGIDLVVMGAYGHSRARELILGGATRSLANHMTAPVLFSH